jgi:hypothetical protein
MEMSMANEGTQRTPAEARAWVKALGDQLTNVTAELDQLAEQVDNEPFGTVNKETTEKVLDVMTKIKILKDEAEKTGNTALCNRTARQWNRVRDVAGLTPRRNRRLT